MSRAGERETNQGDHYNLLSSIQTGGQPTKVSIS
jgi:hypothetical protein